MTNEELDRIVADAEKAPAVVPPENHAVHSDGDGNVYVWSIRPDRMWQRKNGSKTWEEVPPLRSKLVT